LAQESEAQAAAMEWTSASTDVPPAPQNIQVKKEHSGSSKRMQGKKEIHHAIDSHLNMVKLYLAIKIQNYYKTVVFGRVFLLLLQYLSSPQTCLRTKPRLSHPCAWHGT